MSAKATMSRPTLTPRDEAQRIQEAEYEFPYHYIPTLEAGRFSQVRNLRWGYEYLAYTRFVLQRLAAREFDSLLDVGCGDGRFLSEAYKLFPGKALTGVDYFDRPVGLARLLNPNAIYVRGDITDACLFDRKFEAVTLIDTLEHVPLSFIPEFVRGIHQYTAPRGRLIVTVPSMNHKLNRKHYQHFTLASLKESLSPYFTVTEHHFINRQTRRVRVFERLMTNRFFLLNERHLLNAIYSAYEKHALTASEGDCKRICVVCSANRL